MKDSIFIYRINKLKLEVNNMSEEKGYGIIHEQGEFNKLRELNEEDNKTVNEQSESKEENNK